MFVTDKSNLVKTVICTCTYLEEDIDKVEDLAEEELVDIGVVRPKGPENVVDYRLPPRLVLVVVVEHVAVKVLNKHVQLAS
jgi:hypothetical protein